MFVEIKFDLIRKNYRQGNDITFILSQAKHICMCKTKQKYPAQKIFIAILQIKCQKLIYYL